MDLGDLLGVHRVLKGAGVQGGYVTQASPMISPHDPLRLPKIA